MSGEWSEPPGTSADDIEVTGAGVDAYERAPIPLMRVSGPEHRYVAANAAYRALIGHQDLIGRTPREVLDEFAGTQATEILDRIARSGVAEEHRAWRFPHPVEGGERYLDIRASPCVDRGVPGVDVSFLDVTDLVHERAAEQRRAQHLAHRARQQYAEARELVMELQDALLPGDLPVLSRLDVSARYLLAADDTAAGGDWFDAVVRADGTIALVVGDVVGHGVTASAVMGQLRAVLHQRLITEDTVTEALTALDRYARTGSDARAATVCVVQLDPATGETTYCTAGHPAPLVISADGSTRFLTPTGAGPLGARGEFPVREDRLADDEMLLLYTDGIIERPGVTPARSTLDLARVASDAVRGPRSHAGRDAVRLSEQVCELALELLVRVSGYRDDITLLAAQRVAGLPALRLRLPADKTAVRVTRERLADWLEALRIRPLDELCVQHAVGELVANCVEHAYPAGATGSVRVDARIDDTGHLEVTVNDQGRWQPPLESPHRGNGLAMVREFVDHLTLERHAHGTSATLRHRLSRPAHLLRAQADRARVSETPFGVEDLRDEQRLVVRGIVDVSTADSLRHALLQASRGGTTSLVVDLAAVTHLASAGVQVLSEVAAHDSALELQAPMGSVAQHVLETVRLPYRTLGDDPRS